MPYRKPWYMRVRWSVVLWPFVFAVAFGCMLFVAVRCAQAGGQVALTWNQPADCGATTGWELLLAPITTADPDPKPTTATIGVSIPNSGTPPCGLGMTRTATLTSGVGPTRFWLRAVSGSLRSGESNRVDSSVPLAAPNGLQVVVP